MSQRRLIHSQLDLKFWTKEVPTVEAVRPPRCPCCGAASQQPGRPLTVVGHGVRGRQLRGPTQVGEEPKELELQQRRFRCRACGAVMVVAPAQVLRGRLFSSVAIVWALCLYGVEQRAAAEVRHLVNPWRVVGATAARGWRSLTSWAAAVAAGGVLPVKRIVAGTPRQLARAVSWALSALAPPSFRSQSVAHQTVSGALYALMGIRP